jgi:hypothetical protein
MTDTCARWQRNLANPVWLSSHSPIFVTQQEFLCLVATGKNSRHDKVAGLSFRTTTTEDKVKEGLKEQGKSEKNPEWRFTGKYEFHQKKMNDRKRPVINIYLNVTLYTTFTVIPASVNLAVKRFDLAFYPNHQRMALAIEGFTARH